MIHKDLKLEYLYGLNTDLIFKGYWKGQWFQAIFVSGEYEYGWHDMTLLRQFTKEDQGVFNDKNDEYDDIYEALSDVDVITELIVNIK